MKRLSRALSCALLTLCLTACSGSGKIVSFSWFVDEIPSNLDPLMAQTSAEVIACKHLYTGLYQLDEAGVPQPGCASGHQLSADGRTYTFTIRPDLYYRTSRGDVSSYAITAEDFVFAFQRMFRPETHSPYANIFSGILHSTQVLNGQMPETALGVSAPDDHTLVIQLSAPDKSFLEKLTLPGAMPCDEEYFESTDGTYGLSKKTSLSNGDFYLYNWTDGGLFLRRKAQGDLVNNLRLVTNTSPVGTPPTQLVENEKCNAALDTGTSPTSLQQQIYSNTTWCLRFSGNGVFANDPLRLALTSAALDIPLPKDTALYGPTEGIIPDGVRLEAMDYRDRVGSTVPQPGDGDALWQQALTQIQAAELKGLSLLVPEEADRTFVQTLNGTWQQRYGIFLNVETVDAKTFASRLAHNDFTVALAPVQLTVSDPSLLLGSLRDSLPVQAQVDSAALWDNAVQQAGGARLDALAGLESFLADNGYVVPLYRQNARLLIDPHVSGLGFDPFGPVLDVRFAHYSD